MITPALAPPAACSAPRAAARRRCRPHSHQGRCRFSGRTRGGRYSWARYYHPQLQRFISEDPIGFAGGDINSYTYVRNSPLNSRDPSGLCPACAIAAAPLVVDALAAATAATTGFIAGVILGDWLLNRSSATPSEPFPDPTSPPGQWIPHPSGKPNTWLDPTTGETWHWHPGTHRGGDHWDIGGPKGPKGEKGRQEWWPKNGQRQPKPEVDNASNSIAAPTIGCRKC